MSAGLNRESVEHNVAPGQQIDMEYTLRLPQTLTPGEYVLRFDMLEENVAWFEQFGSSVVEHHFTLVE
jgi:hypothetical protein